MAANSLLYLLLTAGLTTPPDQSVTTESPFDENDGLSWSQTERPFEQLGYKTYKSHVWPLATEEPHHEAERHGNWPVATEEPNHEAERHGNWPVATEEPHHEAERPRWKWPLATEQPEDEKERPEDRSQKKHKRKCPSREHFSKCHKNCEKTCSDHVKPKKCPRSCKKGCVCDGGLVRNKEGKCVARDQCPNKLMAQDDDSHGCPYLYACDVYCVTHGHRSGSCEGDTCKCSDK